MSGRALRTVSPATPRHAKSTQVSSVHGVLQPGQQKVLLVFDVLPYQSEDLLYLLFALRAPWVEAFDGGHKIIDLLAFLLDPGRSALPHPRRSAAQSATARFLREGTTEDELAVSLRTCARSSPSPRAW
ncbi:hypothetical protein [Streptomyces avermitilis]|uniref:hypothetical protein n=1 Tax=Streptomyces avermitilis TaxID=33903 RepID=UPI003804FEC8